MSKKTTTTMSWIQKMQQKSEETQTKFMENGLYFNGRPGETIRAICLEEEMTEGETKNGSPIWKIQVMRLSSGKEQTLSVLQSITRVTDQIVAIAMQNKKSLKEVVIDVKFIAGKGQMNYIDTIMPVNLAKLTATTTVAKEVI
jgi:hypothetical protein